jgi:hypothetical protein
MSEPLDEWGRPAEVGGEFIKPKDLRGHLLIVYPIGYIPHIQTRFSSADKKSDAITVDVIDLDDKDEFGAPGKIYRNSNWMQSQLIVALRSMIGGKVLGRIDLGVSRNGMNPPWTLVDALDDPVARERAAAWKQAHPDFRPSTFVVRDPAPAQPQQVQQQPPRDNYTAPRDQQYYYGDPPRNVEEQRQAQQQRPPMVPVEGARSLADEEQTVLQRLRELQAEKARQDQFQDRAPF